ncbi:hypothetical protein [Streptomyces sp. SA15]|uniref:hypothetical protein n=1 Tax=Streptomyces sp. SA15 TaxID=934019 RepID=UPI00211B91FF|nr:hypothetical protein [Streptomyces sp. SA15]
MIKPEQIPQFTGNLPQLEIDYADLKKDAGHVRKTGEDVHSQFQGLSAYYTAPEAEQLFATTKPVKERADDFATDLETVSGALSSYATEIRPLVDKLKELKAKAVTFVDSVKDDDEWEYDGDKVDEHNQIRDDITATVAAFWAAERTCHNKITALWGGTQMVAGDGSERKDQYGFNAEDMKNAKLPWGDPVEEKHKWYEVGHWVKSFVWDGLIVDGIWGTIKGLGMLVGFGGWDAMGQAWKGLAQLATGLTLSMMPGAQVAFWALPDDKLPAWIRDSRTAMKETGKALVAWDQWGKNPARAAGAVTFNVLTTVFTGGAGAGVAGAGKAGAVAKALSVAGKAGRVLDPMTYIAKGAGAGLSKIGDIAASLKGVGNIDIPALPDNAITLPEGTVRLPDGTVNLPEGAAIPDGATRLPDGNIKLPDDAPVLPAGAERLNTPEGEPMLFVDREGNILDERGTVQMDAKASGPTDIVDRPSSGDPAAGADVPRVDSPVREPALVGAATNTADQAGQHIRLGNGVDNNLGDVGRVGEDVPTTPAVHAGGDLPGAGLGDNLPGGTAGNLPGGGVGDNLPTNSLDNHTPGTIPDNQVPGAGTADRLPGSPTNDLGTGGTGPGGHDLPGSSATDGLPGRGPEVPPGGGSLDDLGGAGDDALGDAGRHSDDTPTPDRPSSPERPPFMRDGDNPYGPPGSLTPEQIKEIQVYRANHEPGYFKDHYYADGRRLDTTVTDESGLVPVQLDVDPATKVKSAASDAPPPIPAKYVDGAELSRGRHEVLSPETLQKLDEAAAHRRSSIDYSMSADRHRGALEGMDDSDSALHDAGNEYKAAMNERTKAAESYGEAIAEHQFIPEHYPNSTKETLYGPANGNDQFDQVWRREDGGFVVIEAKSNVSTKMGKRDIPFLDGKRSAMQGSREYFMDILKQMENRGRKHPTEPRLAAELKIALAEGKVDYVLIKGKADGGRYAGYEKHQFNIG